LRWVTTSFAASQVRGRHWITVIRHGFVGELPGGESLASRRPATIDRSGVQSTASATRTRGFIKR
jgi:hypothetical protein